MTPHWFRERAHQHQQRGQDGAEPPLQSSRCADADQLSHEEAEIEAAGVNQYRFRMFVWPRRYTRRIPPVS